MNKASVTENSMENRIISVAEGMPDEREMYAIERLNEAVNREDGTRYGLPEDADRYFFLWENEDRQELKAMIAAFSMGETLDGRPVSEWVCLTRPDCRRQGCFNALRSVAILRETENTVLRMAVYDNENCREFLNHIGAAHFDDELMMRCFLPLQAPAAGTAPGVSLRIREEDGEVRTKYGECWYHMYGTEVYLYGILTYPRGRRQGHAENMLRQLLSLLTERYGAESAFLQVSASNKAALGLYRKLGFYEAERLSYYLLRP